MSWQVAMEQAEKMLNAPSMPSSLELISLIKKVNPTTACLADSERDRGYEIKSRLQNLLLEQYGDAFYLAPHPLNSDIVLIKHAALPSIDACHARLTALSSQALDCVSAPEGAPAARQPTKKTGKVKSQLQPNGDSPAEIFRRAQGLLDEYDFAAAGELLCNIRIGDRDDIVIVERAVRALVEEMGTYEQAIEMLLAQQKQFLRDPRLRVLLARAYHLNGALPEARAILDAMHKGDLDKAALVAYADIAHKDGNLLLAFNLLKMAEETEGYAGGLESLKKEVESAMHMEVEPLLGRAISAHDCGDSREAEVLARQVLQQCPNNQRAREVLARVDSGRRAAEVTALWERLAQTEQCGARLELLERLSASDRENRERIAELITVEKRRQKEESAQARLDHLATLVQEAAWAEAFDVVWWLHGQEDLDDACREACSLSSHLSVLYQNRKLLKISEKSARQLWLDFVKAMTSLRSGQPEGCLELLETVKPYFGKYESFREPYHRALRSEQERARERIKGLLRFAAQEGTSLGQAHNCCNAIRRAIVHLPAEESGEYCRIIEARIAELTPSQTEDELIEAYEYAAQSGNHEKAAILRSQISNQAVLDQFDADLREEFAIERSAVHLEFSETLQVDLLSDQPLLWMGSTDRHLVFREADDAILVVHPEKARATRFASPNFQDLHLTDSIPAEDTFLFRNLKDFQLMWRTDLSDEKSVFTACIDILEFCDDEDSCPTDICLSSERATDYYAVINDLDGVRPSRVVRRRLGSKSPVSDSITIGKSTDTVMKRLSWHPDKFIIGDKQQIKVCARNLTADYRVDISPQDIWAIDLPNRHLYWFDRALLKRADLEFEHTEKFLNSSCCYYFNEYHQRLGLCTTTNTLMVGFGPKAALYDYIGNMISSPFSRGRIIGTSPARKWYTYEYCRETRTLKLRDVTEVLSTLLEWEEAQIPLGDNQEKYPGRQEKLYQQLFFGVPNELKDTINPNDRQGYLSSGQPEGDECEI